jgi:hypothetical protein
MTNEQQQAIRTKITESNLSVFAKDILGLACGAVGREPAKCNHLFCGSDENKDRARKEQIEKEINESGIATIRFDSHETHPFHRPIVTFHLDGLDL